MIQTHCLWGKNIFWVKRVLSWGLAWSARYLQMIHWYPMMADRVSSFRELCNTLLANHHLLVFKPSADRAKLDHSGSEWGANLQLDQVQGTRKAASFREDLRWKRSVISWWHQLPLGSRAMYPELRSSLGCRGHVTDQEEDSFMAQHSGANQHFSSYPMEEGNRQSRLLHLQNREFYVSGQLHGASLRYRK